MYKFAQAHLTFNVQFPLLSGRIHFLSTKENINVLNLNLMPRCKITLIHKAEENFYAIQTRLQIQTEDLIWMESRINLRCLISREDSFNNANQEEEKSKIVHFYQSRPAFKALRI